MKKLYYIFTIFFVFIIQSYSTETNLVLWDIENIDNNIKTIADNKQSQNLSKKLLDKADALLDIKNPTVTDKQDIIENTSKNDYVSLARYWWPNPKTQDGLPYINKDGQSNPELEKYDRNRLSQLENSVNTLSLAYYISKDDKYAKKAVSILKTWFLDEDTRMNPNLNFSQVKKGHNKNRGNRTGVLDSYSFVSMLDSVELLNKKNAISKSDLEGLKTWFSQFLKWLTTSNNGKQQSKSNNNHAVAYDATLIRIAIFCGDTKLAEDILKSFPKNRISKQIKADGTQPEELKRTISFHYTAYNLQHILDVCNMAKSLGVDIYNSQDGAIGKAIDWTIENTKSQSTYKYKQISNWDSTKQYFAKIVNRASKFDKADVYKKYYIENKSENDDAFYTFIYGDLKNEK